MVPLLNAESYAQLTRYMLERCDAIAGIPISSSVESLNASVAVLGPKPAEAKDAAVGDWPVFE